MRGGNVVTGAVLVVNAGSTSLKLSLVEPDERTRAVTSLGDGVGAVAVGHRVVHGGVRLREAVLVDSAVRDAIFEASRLAPLHNGPALAALDEALRRLPDVPHVAVFDSAFHATIPNEAAVYALPSRWREWGVRRYGFHGLSVAWSAVRAPELLGVDPTELRLVVCHLGGGSSVTAVRGGRSLDTTMGFSPLEGLPMATRSGSVDPGALLYLLRERGVSPEELDHVLNHGSGLLGLSGRSGSVRDLEGAEADGDADASLALDVFAHRAAAAVAGMAASLGGLDAIVFTAGIGERSPGTRARICERLRFLGVALDEERNAAARGDAVVAADGSRVDVAVVTAREDVVVARGVRRVVAVPRPA